MLPNFKYYVIQRNSETKQYLEEINERIKDNTSTRKDVPVAVFKSIDMDVMLCMNQNQLKTALSNINTMNEDISDKYAKIIQENMQLIIKNTELKNEVEKYKNQSEDESVQDKSKKKEFEVIIKQQKEKIEELNSIMKLAWDKEAVSVLKRTNIFQNDGIELNKERIITEPTYDFPSLNKVIDIKKDNSSDIHKKFLDRLKEI